MNMTVKECRLEKAAVCSEEDSIQNVAKKLKETGQRHVLVLKKQMPIGIISAVDIVNKIVVTGKNVKKTKAKEIMNKVKCIHHDENVARAYFAMAKENFISCPVVENKKYIGNLNLHEAVRYIAEKNAKK